MVRQGSLTAAEMDQYRTDGFVIARGLYTAVEMDLLRRAAKTHHHPNYTPLEKVADDAITHVAVKRSSTTDDTSFLRPQHDHSAARLTRRKSD